MYVNLQPIRTKIGFGDDEGAEATYVVCHLRIAALRATFISSQKKAARGLWSGVRALSLRVTALGCR
jgi:hypothetical protein